MMNNIYIDSYTASANKRGNTVCGDYSLINRTEYSTDVILSDGMGSGLNANIAAIACASRIMELLNQGITIIRAGEKLAELMGRAKSEAIPFATFTIARILRNGHYTILNYMNPEPIIICNGTAKPIKQTPLTLSGEVLSKSSGMLGVGESIILTTDGVTQAGLGIIKGYGWGVEELAKFIEKKIPLKGTDLCEAILYESFRLSGDSHADDTTIIKLTARESIQMTIASGPPADREKDIMFSRRFISLLGKKVICGSSTAEMIAKLSDKDIYDVKISSSFIQPPKYFIKGIDLVTEGALTLNQVYNILDEENISYDKLSCVSELAIMLKQADEIRFMMGMAKNEGHKDITFKQLGVLPRRIIIPLIAEKLKSMNKLVSIEKI